MNKQENIIGWVRALPRLTEERQIDVLTRHGIGRLVVDNRRVGIKYSSVREDWDRLLLILKPGDTLAVTRTRVLVPAEVWRFQQQLAAAFKAVESIGTKAKPVVIHDIDNGWRSDVPTQRDKMWESATDDFQRVARYESAGRPAMNWTEQERALIERHWFNTKQHRTNALAAEAIRKDAKRLGLARLTDVVAWNLNGHFGASGRAVLRRKSRD